MDGQQRSSATDSLLREVRRELLELELRVAELRDLVGRAMDSIHADLPPDGHEGRFRRGDNVDADAARAARSVAAHMALSGYSRDFAKRRLAGSVSEQSLNLMLDDVFGTANRLSR